MLKKNDHEKAFNALGDSMRRAIFEKLRTKPLAVVDIAEGLPVSRPAVSQHLKVLKDAKLIRIQHKGTRNFCEIDPDGVIAMRFYLDQFWDNALTAFKQAAEQQQKINKHDNESNDHQVNQKRAPGGSFAGDLL